MPGFYTDGATATDLGSIFDYEASSGEAFGAAFDRQLDTNPVALAGRGLRAFVESYGELVDAETARKEVASRGLDLKIPDRGISRYELDTLQYLKQREVQQNTTTARSRGVVSGLAGFAGGLAGSFTDPLNVASGFIPVVGPARYAKWLQQAGTGTFARAGVRAGAGALEGAAGAALIEPVVLAGADRFQLDYGVMDSFLNVTFGSVLGGGLHVLGGAVHDWPGAKAGEGVAALAAALQRDEIADLPEQFHRDAMQTAVRALEDDMPVQAEALMKSSSRLAERPASPLMPEGTLAREVQEVVGVSQVDEAARALARSEYKSAGGEVGAFGPVFSDASGSWEDAVRRLVRAQDGEVPGALSHPEIGPIDVVWGTAGKSYSDGVGLAKIVAHHADVIDELPGIISSLPVTSRSDNRIILQDDQSKSVVRLDYDGKQKTWLLTAYTKDGVALRPADYRQAGPLDQGAVPPAQGEGTIGRSGSTINERGRPQNLADLIDQSRQDRSEAAFNRQFVADEIDREFEAEKARPQDLIEVAKADEEDFGDLVNQYREQGHLTADDEAELKSGDDRAAWAERRAKAFEAAAQCIETA